MAISVRLKTIAELVTPGYRAADIGTDHGYVPIYLLRNDISPYVIAADLSPGSLEKARVNARRARFLIDSNLSQSQKMSQKVGLLKVSNPAPMQETSQEVGFLKDSNPSHGSEKTAPYGIECRLSDGLSAFKPGEVDSIIIAGMGGILMDRILRNGIEVVKSAKELILSPHRDAPLLREFSNEFGFTIVSDIQIEDKKKTYTILKIVI